MTFLQTRPGGKTNHGHVVIVGLGEMKVGHSRTDVLVARSLGSCLGLTLYDEEKQVGGLINCMLPLAEIDPDQARDKPGMFVDSGVEALLKEIHALGGRSGNLVARMAGAGLPMGGRGALGIGHRNELAMRRILQENDIPLLGEDVGGFGSRSLYLYLKDGRTMVESHGKEVEL